MPAPAAATAAARSSVPLCVDDILEQLLSFLKTTPESSVAGSCSQKAQLRRNLEGVPLPLPPVVAVEHRVQFSIRGRRYETTMDVAVTYCLNFYVFFRWPYSGTRTVGEVAVAQTGQRQEQQHLEGLSEEALMTHYTATVEPVLQAFLQQQMQEQLTASSTAERGKGNKAESVEEFIPPALPRPRCISYDAVAKVWKFEFPPRLSAVVEAQERNRRQQLYAAAAVAPSGNPSSTDKHFTSDEINASPFLLLQSDFMGLLLVYLRRCTKVRADAVTQPATAVVAFPTLPIRWAEMNYDEQVSFLQLLRTFGVVPLTAQYARPTAPLTTSQFVGADAALVAAEAKAEGYMCSLRVKAEALGRQQQEEKVQQERTGEKVRSLNKPSREDDFGDLVLPAKGCARCGMAGHATEECRY